MKKLLFLAVSLSVITQADFAQACSCLPTTPQRSFAASQAVFAGRAIKIIQPSPSEREHSNRRRPFNQASEVKVIFEVLKVWKGTKKPQLVVMTSRSSASCGYTFQSGEAYLIYAFNQDSQLRTGLCSGTKLLTRAQADLAVLGEGETPTELKSFNGR